MKRFVLALPIALLACLDGASGAGPEAGPVETPTRAVLRYRAGLERVLAFMDTRPALFPPVAREAPRLPSAEERETIVRAWGAFSDYLLALDSLRDLQRREWALRQAGESPSLQLDYGAFLAEYRFALDFIERVERAPGLDTILNEPLPEIGLPTGSYARLKFRYLNVAIASEFAAYEALARLGRDQRPAALVDPVALDRARIWEMGRGTGPKLTLENAGAVVRRAGFGAWFPVQTGVADFMGDVKVWRPGRSLIPVARRRAMAERLAPGDLLLTRREWFLSNIGLPGYWTHAALYVGTPAERAAYFDADPETREWVRAQGEGSGRLEALLAAAAPQAPDARLDDDRTHPARVLEAIGEGVVFTSLEHAADADSFAALRPRLSKREKAAALRRAYRFSGRPYDFDFDFLTDAELVCTELVYKAYRPAPGERGLSLPLKPILGRLALPANEIARLHAEERAAGASQFDFVLFLDGSERERDADEASELLFRTSWQRPKWHILTEVARQR